MKILDKDGNILENPDLTLGHLRADRIVVAHHDAVPAVEEQWHYEVVAEYPNGGKDVARVVDIFGQDSKNAWDEYEDVLRYIEYNQEELEKMATEKAVAEAEAQRVPNLERRQANADAAIRSIMLTLSKFKLPGGKV